MKILLTAFLLSLPVASLAASPTLNVPSDPNAKYVVVQNKKVGNLSILQTIRKGSSGVSFSTRLFNCSNGTFKYLVNVDGKENMDLFMQENNVAMQSLNESDMSPLVEGSISYYAYRYSCK